MAPFDFRPPTSPDITHWAGYLKYLDRLGRTFPLVPVEDLRLMSVPERAAYDSARIAFLSDQIVARNETVISMSETLTTVMRLNSGKPKGGYGVFASAPSGRGKTTALHAVLCEALAGYLEVDPTCITENRCCPVAYVCIPDSGTPKSIYMEIADFLGVRYNHRDSDPVMRKLVLAGIANSGIQVFVVDEIQNLENGGPFAKRAADAVRRLADDTRATFILAGINLEHTTILTGASRGLQLANRFLQADVADYSTDSTNWKSRWKGLVITVAKLLPLYNTSPSDTGALAKPLHELCHGSVQALNLLVTQAACQLVELRDPSQETITLERLRNVRLNLATEQHVRAELEKTEAEELRTTRRPRVPVSRPSPRRKVGRGGH